MLKKILLATFLASVGIAAIAQPKSTGSAVWLYSIDTAASAKLHEEAYHAAPAVPQFMLAYAQELHRRGRYAEAAKLYSAYMTTPSADESFYALLADCYINTGDAARAIASWKKADHPHKHTAIDRAIYSVYGNSNQVARRGLFLTAVNNGDSTALYPLIALDENWETDWWNSGPQDAFVDADLGLAQALFKGTRTLAEIEAFVQLKKPERTEAGAEQIRSLLRTAKLVIDENPLPRRGIICSDMLRIGFTSGALDEKTFYQTRGAELLALAKTQKDAELLNIYAYLQATADGKVDTTIDLAGWKELHDERFAISYFMGRGAANRLDDPELAVALVEFPNSSPLYWVKTNCAKIDGKPMRPYLQELIRREFKTLGTDESRFSYRLDAYFAALAAER